MLIKSQEITQNENFLYSDVYEIDRDGEIKEIRDEFIVNEDIALKRAIAEFLEFGEKQEVEFITYFAPLKINDIIKISAPTKRIPKELNKDRFIIKNIRHYFKNGVIKTKIKAVRYD